MLPNDSLETLDTIILSDPLTLDGIPERRSKGTKIVGGPAAKADIESFKGKGVHAHKPMAKSFDHRFTIESNSRQPGLLKATAKYFSPAVISLGGGLPSPEYFPLDSVSMKVPAPGKFSEEEIAKSGVTLITGKRDIQNGISEFDITVALNSCRSVGSPQLLRWAYEHTEIIHNPPYQDWQVAITVGSTSALDTMLRMFGTAGLYMLSEEFTYTSAVQNAAPLGIKTAPVGMDEQGMLPDALDRILTHWEPSKHSGAPKPFLVYLVPTGQNPTGATQSLERRKAIYKVGQKHDLIFLEDDPYYFLQMQPYNGAKLHQNHEEFIESLIPSLLSLDTDGRVIRMDSFSKVIGPGIRVGWITAPAKVVERWGMHVDVAIQGPSGMSQLVLFKLLDEHWGHTGYLDWLIYIRLAYSRRRDIMIHACDEFLPYEVMSWRPPMAGMFHWIKVNWTKHPLATSLTFEEIEERIFLRIIDEGALVIRGSLFRAEIFCQNEIFDPEARKKQSEMFLRATFAAAPGDKIREAIRRVGEAVRAEFDL